MTNGDNIRSMTDEQLVGKVLKEMRFMESSLNDALKRLDIAIETAIAKKKKELEVERMVVDE